MKLELDNSGIVDISSQLSWEYQKDLDIVILRPNREGTRNVLTQSMINTTDTKYIVNYIFDLRGKTITLPPNVVVEIDGGSLCNGTLVGNNSLIINTNQTENALKNITLEGTWKPSSRKLVVLTEDEYEALQVKDPETIYFTVEE